ncbi:peptidoglycan-binding domain-containing protein [Desulfoferula mesophila]|uniref:Peptidoglycan binding-like domain-containing protein n=1 Tax=Desulfoferula mesophila TaxID=3058419 RepID=A0AAU9F3D4_9BACT|nr:hypothetical protein FAK_41340 [Desulfoferula mesophilus]
MAQRFLTLCLLLLCAACATPHDLVQVPSVTPAEVCSLLSEAGYQPGDCRFVMDTEQMRRALMRFQEDQRLAPADGNLDQQTWARLKAAARERRRSGRPWYQAGPRDGPEPPPPPAAPAPTPAKPKPAPPSAAPSPAPSRTALQPGDEVYVLERAKCLPQGGAWLLVYVGQVRSLEEGRVWVTLSERLSYRYNPGEKGVNAKDWFCVPRRRHCYSPVPFGDWGGRYRPGQTAAFDQGKAHRLSGGRKDNLYGLARNYCRQTGPGRRGPAAGPGLGGPGPGPAAGPGLDQRPEHVSLLPGLFEDPGRGPGETERPPDRAPGAAALSGGPGPLLHLPEPPGV